MLVQSKTKLKHNDQLILAYKDFNLWELKVGLHCELVWKKWHASDMQNKMDASLED